MHVASQDPVMYRCWIYFLQHYSIGKILLNIKLLPKVLPNNHSMYLLFMQIQHAPSRTSRSSVPCRFHMSVWRVKDFSSPLNSVFSILYPNSGSKAWLLGLNPVSKIDSLCVVGKITKPFQTSVVPILTWG